MPTTYLWTVDYVTDVGAVFAAGFGQALSQGGKNVTSGYFILPTDRLVTVASTGGAAPCVINLLRAADATGAVAIKNVGTVALAITPNGSDVVDGVNTAYTIPAASGATQPTGFWSRMASSAWFLLSSHGL